MENEREIINQEVQIESTLSFEIKERNTTYVIGIHFSEGTKDTIDKKIKHLIRDEVKMNFIFLPSHNERLRRENTR